MDEHTVYKSQPIHRMGWTQPFFKKGLGGLPAQIKSHQSKSLVSSGFDFLLFLSLLLLNYKVHKPVGQSEFQGLLPVTDFAGSL